MATSTPLLKWDQTGERLYETGNKKGVIYPYNTTAKAYDSGAAWNGLTGVTESPSGAEATDLWADDVKYLTMRSAEQFGGTIEAYTYPDEFGLCDGSAEIATGVTIGQQKRSTFGLSYVTTLGNDTEMNDYGYKIHLVYGCSVSPSQRGYSTINDSPEAITFSWEFTSTPVAVAGHKDTSIVIIDSTKIAAEKLANLEEALYGVEGGDTYTEFTGAAFVAHTVYYTRTGTEGAYVYTVTTDTTPQQGTTYYTNGAKSPYLPLPAEVVTLLA